MVNDFKLGAPQVRPLYACAPRTTGAPQRHYRTRPPRSPVPERWPDVLHHRDTTDSSDGQRLLRINEPARPNALRDAQVCALNTYSASTAERESNARAGTLERRQGQRRLNRFAPTATPYELEPAKPFRILRRKARWQAHGESRGREAAEVDRAPLPSVGAST